MRRRKFISLFGSAAAATALSLPLAGRAQQTGMPVVGYLSSNSPDDGEARALRFVGAYKKPAMSWARTLRWNTAGPSNRSIGCPRWRRTSLNVV